MNDDTKSENDGGGPAQGKRDPLISKASESVESKIRLACDLLMRSIRLGGRFAGERISWSSDLCARSQSCSLLSTHALGLIGRSSIRGEAGYRAAGVNWWLNVGGWRVNGDAQRSGAREQADTRRGETVLSCAQSEARRGIRCYGRRYRENMLSMRVRSSFKLRMISNVNAI